MYSLVAGAASVPKWREAIIWQKPSLCCSRWDIDALQHSKGLASRLPESTGWIWKNIDICADCRLLRLHNQCFTILRAAVAISVLCKASGISLCGPVFMFYMLLSPRCPQMNTCGVNIHPALFHYTRSSSSVLFGGLQKPRGLHDKAGRQTSHFLFSVTKLCLCGDTLI